LNNRLKRLWTFTPLWGSTVVTDPVVWEDWVFFTSGDTVYKLERKTGQHIWSHAYLSLSGLGRYFPRFQRLFFNSSYGIPVLSRQGEMICVQYATPTGDTGCYVFNGRTHADTQPDPQFEKVHPDWKTIQGPDGMQLEVHDADMGRVPVLRVRDKEGNFLWNSSAISDTFKSCEVCMAFCAPVIAGEVVLFGLQDYTMDRGTPIHFKLFALRLHDGTLAWTYSQSSEDAQALSAGFAAPWCWIVTRVGRDAPVLQLLHTENGKSMQEAQTAGLSSGGVLHEGVFYGGFGRYFMALELIAEDA